MSRFMRWGWGASNWTPSMSSAPEGTLESWHEFRGVVWQKGWIGYKPQHFHHSALILLVLYLRLTSKILPEKGLQCETQLFWNLWGRECISVYLFHPHVQADFEGGDTWLSLEVDPWTAMRQVSEGLTPEPLPRPSLQSSHPIAKCVTSYWYPPLNFFLNTLTLSTDRMKRCLLSCLSNLGSDMYSFPSTQGLIRVISFFKGDCPLQTVVRLYPFWTKSLLLPFITSYGKLCSRIPLTKNIVCWSEGYGRWDKQAFINAWGLKSLLISRPQPRSVTRPG